MAYYAETGRSRPPDRLTLRITRMSHFCEKKNWNQTRTGPLRNVRNQNHEFLLDPGN
jgi:hypothetical protein